jgi:hypothetical protein
MAAETAMVTELDIARAIAEGTLPSPQHIENSYLVALRISGTGCAWRPAHREFCWRAPEIWLSAVMMRRCTGLFVVVEHPPGADGLLTLPFLRQSIVGVCVFPFVRDAELWTVARLLSREAAEAISDPDGFEVDTSPCVLFDPGATASSMLTLGRGEKLLVEPVPQRIDHLALVITPTGDAGGVWSRGNAGAGAGAEQPQLQEA